MGYEFAASVRRDMSRNAISREHMLEVKLSDLFCLHIIRSGEEKSLLSQSIDNDKDCSVSGRHRKLFNEIHGYGMPGAFRNGKLLESSVCLVTSGLSSSASDAGFDKLVDGISHLWPSI